jgi:hypothetical protein
MTPCSSINVNKFGKNISPPSSGLKNKPNERLRWKQTSRAISQKMIIPVKTAARTFNFLNVKELQMFYLINFSKI